MFFNLGCLPARVKACITHLEGEADAAASSAFQPATLADATSAGGLSSSSPSPAEPTSPTPASAAGGGRGPSAREAGASAARRRAARMRAHAGKLAGALHGITMEAWGLQRVLDKKRDPTTRALLDVTVRGDRAAGLSAGAYRAYWDGLCLAVRGAVERALVGDRAAGVEDGGGGFGGGRGGGAAGGGAALVTMYPSLRKAFLHLIKRVEDGTRGGSQGGVRRGDGGGVARSVAVAPPGVVPAWSRSAAGGGGILGGSRWLSLALDGDDDDSSEGEQYQGDRRGVGGAEAGAGPTKGDEGVRRGVGVLRRGRLRAGGRGAGGEEAKSGGEEGSDGERLLESLGPLRDLFLARSVERLTTPVEQMFPQVNCLVFTCILSA